jgi:hypothetical protein
MDAAWKRANGELVLSDFAFPDEPDVTWWFEVFLGRKPLVEIN